MFADFDLLDFQFYFQKTRAFSEEDNLSEKMLQLKKD